MSTRVLIAAAAACVAGAFVVAWLFELSLDHVLVLAPVIVLGTAVVAGLLLLWTRALYESYKRSAHPRRIAAAAVAFVALVIVLTLLGVQLPREG